MSDRVRMWVPEKIMTPPSADFAGPEMRVGISGHFKCELLDAKTQRVKETWEFKNVITDSGSNLLMGSTNTGQHFIAALFSALAVGSDATEPNASQSALGAEIGTRSTSTGGTPDVSGYVTGSGGLYGYHFYRIVRLFTETQANGSIRELGFFTNTTGGTMMNRALIRDATGSAATIVKTSDDQFRVTFEWRIFPPETDVTGSFTWGSTTYNYTIRPIAVTNALSWGTGVQGSPTRYGAGYYFFIGSTQWGDIDAGDSYNLLSPTASFVSTGSFVAASSSSNVPYVSGTFKRQGDTFWEPGVANFTAGIKAFVTPWLTFNNTTLKTYQIQISPPIMKTSTDRLSMRWSITLVRL